MKKLNELFEGAAPVEISGIKINSKEVVPGDLFVCTMGVNCDRHDFVDDAIKRGAVAIVASKPLQVTVPVIYVEDTNRELASLMARFTDYPDKKLSLIGVTGTNGKTTVAELVQDLMGEECAYIGTNGIDCSQFHEAIRNTTPDVDRMYLYLKRFYDAGCRYVSMETSSEAFYRHRLDDFHFDVTILTNITEDHLNVHKTIENYVECKCQLFAKTAPGGTSILNYDDPHYEKVRSYCKEKVLTYGYLEEADLWIQQVQLAVDHTTIMFRFLDKSYTITSPLIGSFNVVNLAASLLVLVAYGYSMEEAIARIPQIQPVLGRMELLSFGQPYQIVLDYAHTPDALDQILTFLNQIKKGRIITLTGSAGGRETEKRSGMGKVVLEKSDYVIFTMDDPRNEDVNTIIDQLIGDSSNTNYERICDRTEAIHKALSMAQANDIVLIAGKGRDNYMAVGNEYLPYCDYDEVEKYFKEKNQA